MDSICIGAYTNREGLDEQGHQLFIFMGSDENKVAAKPPWLYKTHKASVYRFRLAWCSFPAATSLVQELEGWAVARLTQV